MGLNDPRSYGSKNPGATNVLRSGNKLAAVATLLLDAIKGWLPMALVQWQGAAYGLGDGALAAVGLAAFLGHLFPVFFSFKGGKGVATLFGMLIALNPAVAGLALAVFVVTNIITGYVSIGSLLAGLSIPFLFVRVFGETDLSILIFSFLVAGLVLVTHRKNVKRLIAGEETKTRIVMKQKK